MTTSAQALADAPPGPGLCARLAGIDPARVTGGDTVDLLRAWRRLRSYVDAQEMTVMAELGRRDPDAGAGVIARLAEPDPACGREIAAALHLTERTAYREHGVADVLVHRIPDVLAALARGDIDRGRAVVFAELLEPLTDAQARRVCDRLLPKASGLNSSQLRYRLRRMVISIDPEAARRRYEKALRKRGVVCYLDEDGVATFTAFGLDPTAAQAACERLDALARAIRGAGHPDSISVIRADLTMALLAGSLHAMSHARIVETMLARAADAALGGAGDDTVETGTPSTARSAGTSDGRPADDTERDTDLDRGPGPGSDDAPEHAPPGIDIRIRLSTLLGHDDHPGEIPGLGPVPADTGRDCVARHRHAEWRFAVTDPAGRLLLGGVTRRRPPITRTRSLPRQAHGGTVELQVPADLLAHLAADPPPGWEALIADLATRYGRRAELDAELDTRPEDRFPHPMLRRHVEIRDRTCTFPGCQRPARKAQQDHTRDHQYGGPSVTGNLGPLCVLHHALKTAGHWRVEQPEPGLFRWQSPRGKTYDTRGEPVCPSLPDPLPGGDEYPPSAPNQADVDLHELSRYRSPTPRPDPDGPADDRAPPF